MNKIEDKIIGTWSFDTQCHGETYTFDPNGVGSRTSFIKGEMCGCFYASTTYYFKDDKLYVEDRTGLQEFKYAFGDGYLILIDSLNQLKKFIKS